MTVSDELDTAGPPRLAERLASAAAALEQIPAGTPAPVRLAHAWNGFYTARTVTVLLSAEAVPHRDAYDLAAGWCTQALGLLYDTIGREVVRRYSPDHAAGTPRLRQLAAVGEAELCAATDADIDNIAAAMTGLAASLQDLLAAVAADETALPGLRAAARTVTGAAHNIWSHYGGDSGGW